MVGQNKRFSFKIKRQAKNLFPRDVERTVVFMPRGYKTFFMLNSTEHENFSANKYENANKKVFGIGSNLRFISKTNFMLS